MFKILLIVIFGSFVLKIMDISKTIKTGEQVLFKIYDFNIVKIKKEKIPDTYPLKHILNDEITKNKCYPNEEHLYKKIENLIESIEYSISYRIY